MGFRWDVVQLQLWGFSEMWIDICLDFHVCGVVVYVDFDFVCLCVPVMLIPSFDSCSFEVCWTPIMLIIPQRRLDSRKIAVDLYLDFASRLRGFGVVVILWYVLGVPSYGFGLKLYLRGWRFVENWIWVNTSWTYVDLGVHVIMWILCHVFIFLWFWGGFCHEILCCSRQINCRLASVICVMVYVAKKSIFVYLTVRWTPAPVSCDEVVHFLFVPHRTPSPALIRGGRLWALPRNLHFNNKNHGWVSR